MPTRFTKRGEKHQKVFFYPDLAYEDALMENLGLMLFTNNKIAKPLINPRFCLLIVFNAACVACHLLRLAYARVRFRLQGLDKVARRNRRKIQTEIAACAQSLL